MGGGEKGQTAWTPSIVLTGFKGMDVGGAGMELGIGWELQSPTMQPKPPTALPAYDRDLL